MTVHRLFLIGVLGVASSCVRQPIEEDSGLIHREFEMKQKSAGRQKSAASKRAPENNVSGRRSSESPYGRARTDSANGDQAQSRKKKRKPDEGVTAVFPARGEVVSVNPKLEFVVLEFLPSRMPAAGTELKVFRNGKAIGTVRVTDPTMNNLVTADLISGAAQRGDEVRQK